MKDKTLGPMDFEAEGRELEAVLGRAKVKAMDQFGRDELQRLAILGRVSGRSQLLVF